MQEGRTKREGRERREGREGGTEGCTEGWKAGAEGSRDGMKSGKQGSGRASHVGFSWLISIVPTLGGEEEGICGCMYIIHTHAHACMFAHAHTHVDT